MGVLFVRDDDGAESVGSIEWAGPSCRVLRCSVHVMRKISGLKSEDGATDAAGIMSLPQEFCGDAGVEPLRSWVEARCQESEEGGARILVLDQVQVEWIVHGRAFLFFFIVFFFPRGDATRCECRCALVLLALQDPGNLGTILRTALAFGWSGVVLTEGSCDPLNDKALRASRGAPFRLPIAQVEVGEWKWGEGTGHVCCSSWLVGRPGGLKQARTEAVFDALAARAFDMYATVAADAAEDPERVSAMLRGERGGGEMRAWRRSAAWSE